MTDIKAYPGGSFLKNSIDVLYEKYRQTGFPTPSGKMEFTSLLLREAGVDSLPVYREPEQSSVSGQT
ncbi:MAG: hypothetical protein JW882_04420 [Deltaproteobacteria bacterium]|nr:hypothetical protein [Deltaproteobacteria bacterium]